MTRTRPADRGDPVVVAGAGPVGLTTALVLARAGVRTIVLERKAAPDPRSRATLVVPRSVALFRRLGVLDALVAEGQRLDAIRVLRATDRKRLLTFDFASLAEATLPPTQAPFALALSQDRTERILLDAVRASGLVDVVFATPLARFDAGLDTIRIEAGGRSIDAPFLVGADGARSTVREALGWTQVGKTYPTRAVLADVRIDPGHDTAAGWLVDTAAPSFTIAIRFADGTWRIIEAAVDDAVTDADLPDRARRRTDALFGPGAWRETLWTAAYRKHARRAPRYVRGRVALAGDAAHLNSPAGGQGMNAGLADAEALGSAIAAALERPGHVDQLLAAYERQRIAAFDREIRGFTDALEAMETLPRWLRRLAFAAVGIARASGIERLVTRRLAMLDDHRSASRPDDTGRAV